jgi:hypothetical protein
VFETLQKEFGLSSIQGSRSPISIAKELRGRVEKILTAASSAEKAEKASAAQAKEPVPAAPEKAPNTPEPVAAKIDAPEKPKA